MVYTFSFSTARALFQETWCDEKKVGVGFSLILYCYLML